MVAYQSLKDHVYDYLSAQITSGQLKPNESINEASICAALQISRTPVREALMQLSNEGYIEHIPRRGFFTREMSLERVRNIYEIIGNLEAMGAALAMDHPDLLDLDELHRLAKQMDQVIVEQKYDAYQQLQNQFHNTIIQASNNEDLVRLVANLKKFFMRQEYVYETATYDLHTMFLKMNEEHWHILQLMETGDKETLRAFLRDEHWNIKYAAYHTYT